MQSHENSNSGLFPSEDGEHSQSQSQVRARRAIRLDSQVSLGSLHDNADDGLVDDAQAMAGNPRSMFAPRDLNAMPIDVKQRQQMLMMNRSNSAAPASLSRPASRPHSRARVPHPANTTTTTQDSNKSSAARSVLGLRMQHQLPKSVTLSRSNHHSPQQLQHRPHSLRSGIAAGNEEEGGDEDQSQTEETVMMVGGVVLSTRSSLSSAAASSARPLTHNHSPSPARPAPSEETASSCLGELARTASAAAGEGAASEPVSAAPSPTPPPRRAFVLSRLPSADDDKAAAPAEIAAALHHEEEEPDAREENRAVAAAQGSTSAKDLLRESLLLVGHTTAADSSGTSNGTGTEAMARLGRNRPPQRAQSRASLSVADEDDDNSVSLVLGDLPAPPPASVPGPHKEGHEARETAPERAAAQSHPAPHRVLKPGEVIEEGTSSHEATTEVAQAAVATMGSGRPFLLTGVARSDSFDPMCDSSIMSPLPRPVHPSTFLGSEPSAAPRGLAKAEGAEEMQEQGRDGSDASFALPCSDNEAKGKTTADASTSGTAAPQQADTAFPCTGSAAADSANLTSFSLLSTAAAASASTNAAALEQQEGQLSAAEDAPACLATDSIFIQSSLFLSGTGQSVVHGSKKSSSSMLLVGGETPTPLRELRENIRRMYGPQESAEVDHHHHNNNNEQSREGSQEEDTAQQPPRQRHVEEKPVDRSSKAISPNSAREGEDGEAGVRAHSPSPRPPVPLETTAAFTMSRSVSVEERGTKDTAHATGTDLSPHLSIDRTPQHPPRRPLPRGDQDGEGEAELSGLGQQTPSNTPTSQPQQTSLLATPSARISDEVKELVERAQAEVRRTRDSLLSALQTHKASFIPTSAAAESGGEVGTIEQRVRGAAATDDSAVNAVGAKPLDFTEAEATPAQDRRDTLASLTTEDVPPKSMEETSFFANWNMNQLRSRLCESADSILRRLKGYDSANHGVLPMDTVIRVTFYVLHRKFGSNVGGSGMLRHLFTEESLTWLNSAAAVTPSPTPGGRHSFPVFTPGAVRGAAGQVGSTARREREQHRSPFLSADAEATVAATATATATPHVIPRGSHGDSLCLTPRSQAAQMRDVIANATPSVYARWRGGPSPTTSWAEVSVSTLTTGKRSRDEHDGEGAECKGRPATRMSPTRTLERVMAQQAARTAEEGFMAFYLFVLSAFREVFGERYALRHLGATNASKHDVPLAKGTPTDAPRSPPLTRAPLAGYPRRLNFTTTPTEGTLLATTCAPGHRSKRPHHDEGDGHARPYHGLSDIDGPLESAFPRLRQHYSMKEGGSLADGRPEPRRTPPMDVLVYYTTFVESLKEL